MSLARPALAICLALAALLAACGPRATATVSGSGGATVALPKVRPPAFGDAKPVAFEVRAPDRYPVHGIDISRWQAGIDWAAARDSGVSFAFIKATEGGDLVDPAFAGNWRGAAAAGVPRGAYHFHYHCRPAAEQARWFIRNVPKEAGALPPVLDIEWTPFSPTCRDRPAAETVRAEAAVFLRIVEAHYGQAAIIYTTPDFYTDTELWRLPGRHEFWLRSVTAHPADRYQGQHWTFWQYTGTGLVPGIGGMTDINAFAGSREAWADWLARRSL